MLQKINGAQYNTKAKQQSAYSNIQVKSNALWGEPIVKKTTPLNKPLPKEDISGFSGVSDYLKNNNYKPTTLTDDGHNKISNEPYYDKKLSGYGIQLDNKFNDNQKKIAEKYTPFFKNPVAINYLSDGKTMNDYVGNPKVGGDIMGVNDYMSDGSRKVTVRGDLSDKFFELSMLHEIGHQVFHYNEESASAYALEMMKTVNEQLGINN